MIQYVVRGDKIYSLGEVDYLGVPAHRILLGQVETLPDNYDGWFPFMRMCYSLGDLGITSGIFEALKAKYPKIKIAWPSNRYIESLLGRQLLSSWSYNGNTPWDSNVLAIMKNNPYIDKIFEVGEFSSIFTDHDRSYTGLIHDGVMVRSCDEPLAEQILRRFGFTDEDFRVIDCKPKVYFSEEESTSIDGKLKKLIGDSEFGCLLLASRFKKDKWKGQEHLIELVKPYYGMPLFYFSEQNLQGSKWEEYFPNLINFSSTNFTIREQIYVKQRAAFNVGYQAGITDAASGYKAKAFTLCPFPTIRENCIRGGTYVFADGTIKVIEDWK